jgi:hypothetical protein
MGYLVIRGLFPCGEITAIMVKPPFISPEPPTPATARPMISIFELVATPHKSEPSSNMDRNIRNVIY